MIKIAIFSVYSKDLMIHSGDIVESSDDFFKSHCRFFKDLRFPITKDDDRKVRKINWPIKKEVEKDKYIEEEVKVEKTKKRIIIKKSILNKGE